MKTVLILSDFKSSSKKAMDFAIGFAKQYHFNVVLLHVITPEMRKSPILINHNSNLDTFNYLENVIKSLDERTINLLRNDDNQPVNSVEYVVETGGLVDAIEDMMSERLIDLIIMGTHAPNSYNEKSGNTFTSEVLQNVNCPILVIPENAEDFKIDHITFATTLKNDQIKAFMLLGEWQRVFDCKVDVLYLNDPAHLLSNLGVNERVDELAKEGNLKINEIFTSIHVSNTQKEIENFVNDKHTDMLAMVTHKRTQMQRWLQGSMTESAVNHVSIPVLSFEPALLEG